MQMLIRCIFSLRGHPRLGMRSDSNRLMMISRCLRSTARRVPFRDHSRRWYLSMNPAPNLRFAANWLCCALFLEFRALFFSLNSIPRTVSIEVLFHENGEYLFECYPRGILRREERSYPVQHLHERRFNRELKLELPLDDSGHRKNVSPTPGFRTVLYSTARMFTHDPRAREPHSISISIIIN